MECEGSGDCERTGAGAGLLTSGLSPPMQWATSGFAFVSLLLLSGVGLGGHPGGGFGGVSMEG